jgi:hypothetical protein
LTQEEAQKKRDQAEEQINKLISFALFAAFERKLRDHLSDNMNPLSEATTIPKELALKLHEFLGEEADHWRIDYALDLFSPPVDQHDLSNAKNIRTYRHHIAHGAAPPNAIPPHTVYNQLTEFLKNAGLVT